MPLKQAAIIPHPPILIPSIGKENLPLLKQTNSSYNKLKESLIENKIETIVIITSHGQVGTQVFNVNEEKNFEINFEEFGDYTTKMEIEGDKILARLIKEGFSAHGLVNLIKEKKLDHGAGVPIYSLLKDLKHIKIIPIYISNLSLREHFYFGKKLKAIIEKCNKKTAVLASGDLSHTINEKAPAPYSPKASRFDKKLIEYISDNKLADILNLKQELIDEVKPCGLKSIAILLGILKGINYEIESQTYEAPFGVGYLSMQISIRTCGHAKHANMRA